MIKIKFPYKFPYEIKRDVERDLTILKSQFFEIETDEIDFTIEPVAD